MSLDLVKKKIPGVRRDCMNSNLNTFKIDLKQSLMLDLDMLDCN